MTDLHSPPAPPAPRPDEGRGRRTPARPCTNCGDPTVGNFCPNCGQRKVEVRVSTRRMLLEALDDQFSLNSALPRTLGALFFRPGRLTREYVDGRIVRYIPPLRLYLFASLVFFLVLSLVPEVRRMGFVRMDGAPVTSDSTGVRADSAAAGDSTAADSAAARDTVPKDWAKEIDFRTPIPAVNRAARAKLDQLDDMPPAQAMNQLMAEYLERAPAMMIAFLPVFAAVLKLLYIRRRRFYVEHFVFALHVHAFAFVTGTAMLLLRWQWLELALMAWLFVYIYLAMKAFYAQGWIKTGLKYLALGFAYNVLMVIAFVITLVVALLML